MNIKLAYIIYKQINEFLVLEPKWNTYMFKHVPVQNPKIPLESLGTFRSARNSK